MVIFSRYLDVVLENSTLRVLKLRYKEVGFVGQQLEAFLVANRPSVIVTLIVTAESAVRFPAFCEAC